jgi:RHS repeat-associated protein
LPDLDAVPGKVQSGCCRGHGHGPPAGYNRAETRCGARYYRPLFGRFLSPDTAAPDPKRPLGWNRYSYVEDGPETFVVATASVGFGDTVSCGLTSVVRNWIGYGGDHERAFEEWQG